MWPLEYLHEFLGCQRPVTIVVKQINEFLRCGYAKLINESYVSAEGKLFSAKISATTRRPRFRPKFRPPHGDPDIPPNFGHHTATQLRSVSFSFRVRSVFVSFRFDSKLFPPNVSRNFYNDFSFELISQSHLHQIKLDVNNRGS